MKQIIYRLCKYSSVNVSKNKMIKYLGRAGYKK